MNVMNPIVSYWCRVVTGETLKQLEARHNKNFDALDDRLV